MMRCLVCVENTPYQESDIELDDNETISLCSSFCIALKLNFSRYKSQLYKTVFCNECKRRLKEVPSILSIPNSIDEDDEISSKIKQIMLDGYLAQMDREMDNSSSQTIKEPDCPFQSTRLEILKELGLVVELDDEPDPSSPVSEHRIIPVTSSYNSKLPIYIDLELDEEIPPDEILSEVDEVEEIQTNTNDVVVVVDGTKEIDKELNNSSGTQNEETKTAQEGQEKVQESVKESSKIPEQRIQESKIQPDRPRLPEGIVFVPQPRAVSLIAAEKIKSVFATSGTNKIKDKTGTNLLSSSSSCPEIRQKISNKTITKKKTKNKIQELDMNGRTVQMKTSTKEKSVKKVFTKTKKKNSHTMSKSSKENKKLVSASPGDDEMPALSAPYLEESEVDSSEVDTRINEDDDGQIEMPQLDVEIENVNSKKNKKKMMQKMQNSKKRNKQEEGFQKKAVEKSHTKNSKNTKSLKQSKYHKSSSINNSNRNKKSNSPIGGMSSSKLPIEYRSCSVIVENFSIEQIAEAASRNNVKIPSIIIGSSKTNDDVKSVSKKSLVSPIKAKEQLISTTKELSLSSSSPTTSTVTETEVRAENSSVHVPKNIVVGDDSVPNNTVSSVQQTATTTTATTSTTQPMVNDNVISSTTSVINSTTTTIDTTKNSTDTSVHTPINTVSNVVNSSIPDCTIKFCNSNQYTVTNSATTYATNRKSKRKPLKPTKGICASTLLSSQQESQKQQKLQGDNTQSFLPILPEQTSQSPIQQMEMQINAKSQNETSNDKSINGMHIPSLPSCVHTTTMTAATITSASNNCTTTIKNINEINQEAQIQLTKSNSSINGPSLFLQKEGEQQPTSATSRINKRVHDNNNLESNCILNENNKEIQTKKMSDKYEKHHHQQRSNNNSSIRTSPRKTFSPTKNASSNIHLNTANDKNNNEVKEKASKTSLSSSSSSSSTITNELKSKPKGPPYLPLKISESEIEKVTAVPQKISLLKTRPLRGLLQIDPSIIQHEDATRAVSALVNFRHDRDEQVQRTCSTSPLKSYQNSKVTESTPPKIPKLTITNVTKHSSSNKSADVGTVYMIKGNRNISHDNSTDSILSNNNDPNGNVDNNDEDDRMSEISDSELGFLQEETNRFKFGLRPRRETIMKIKTALESDSESDKSIKSKDSDNTESDPMFSERYRKKKKLKATNTLNKLSKLYGSAQSTSYGIIIKKKKDRHDRYERKKKQDAEKNQNVNHSNESSYSCDKCQKNFSKFSKLKSHMKQHEKNGTKKFNCETCGKGFNYAAKLVLHKKLHTDQKEFQCHLCPRSFTSQQYLNIHTKNHPPPSNELNHFPCDQCDASFVHLSTLREHQRQHTGELPFQCDICNQRFPFLSRLKRHQSVKHLNIKPYKCRYCGIAFKQAGNLKCHEKRHDEKNKKFQCPYPNCSLRFFDQNKLKYHLTVHSGEKSYGCNKCLKSFLHSSSLKSHVCTVPVKKRPLKYICRVCNRQFAQKQYLNYHQKSHPELQNSRYTCPEAGCGRSFTGLSNLREHARKHTNDFPFQCELCEYKVAFRSRLLKHMLKHTTEKKFDCEVCHKKFAVLAYKTRHMKNVHMKNKGEVDDQESFDEDEGDD